MGVSSLLPTPPAEADITAYDRAQAAVYLRLLDAERDGAAWDTVAAVVLLQDVKANPAGARRMYVSHLERAHWLRDGGFFRLLGERPVDNFQS
jgi:hypothetical protein